MLKIWEKNMKNVRKALICSVFKSLREFVSSNMVINNFNYENKYKYLTFNRKEADMKRAKTLIQFLFDSIATMESILEYEKGEVC